MTQGYVKRLVADRGFGFIKASNGIEFFFHSSAVVGSDFDDLRPDMAVTFEEEQGPKGPRAHRVSVE